MTDAANILSSNDVSKVDIVSVVLERPCKYFKIR